MRCPLAVLALAALASVALAEEPAAAPKPYAIGDTVADFTAKDVDGADVSLASLRDVTPEKALAAVTAAATAYGAKDAKASAPPPGAADPIDGLAGVKSADGAVDPAKRVEFLKAAGKPFGLVAGKKTSEAVKTLGDVAKWIAGSGSAPLVLMVWSPKCPVVAMYGDRIADLFADTGARLVPIAPNVTDSDDEIRDFLATHAYPVRVLVDRDQKLTDLLGANHTPHSFLLDAKNTLRYAGTIDDDPLGEKGDARQEWLKTAIDVVGSGHGKIRVLMTAPEG